MCYKKKKERNEIKPFFFILLLFHLFKNLINEFKLEF